MHMIKKITHFITISLCLLAAANSYSAKVAIIIDDIGYRQTDSMALTLPGKVSFAVLPHTPFGKALADKITELDKEVMLHIPMEAMNGKFMGPGGLSATMSKSQLNAELASALVDIPQAVGINNHMGSKLTTLKDHMQWTMEFLKEKDLFFLDSKTNRHSLAEDMAKTVGIPTLSRHVFLDNELSEDYITGQFEQMIRHAKRYGMTVAIAHPHPESIQILSKLIPKLKNHNIELVSVSALLNNTTALNAKLATTE